MKRKEDRGTKIQLIADFWSELVPARRQQSDINESQLKISRPVEVDSLFPAELHYKKF